MNTPPNLNEHLTHEADGFFRRGGTELDLSQVLDRAGEIRRGRRLRATLVMAACVLAVAVPTVLIATGRDDHPVTPAHQVKADRSPISLTSLANGDRPATGWVQGNVWHGADGYQFTWSKGRTTAVANLGKAVLLGTSGPQGQRAHLMPVAGNTALTVSSWPMTGRFAISADGRLAAFVEPDGTPVVVPEGRDPVVLPQIPTDGALTASAVTGTDCSSPDTGGCTVWASDQGPRPAVWQSFLGGRAQRFGTDLRSVADIDTNHLLVGVTSVTDNGSCSALEAPDGRSLWRTCDHTLLSFSPDSQHLLATTAYRDGLGDTELAVLDSSSDRPVLDLRTTDQAAITQMEWEDDTHVLATVFDHGRWAVLRIGLDGQREYAVPPVAGDDTESPFVLPSR